MLCQVRTVPRGSPIWLETSSNILTQDFLRLTVTSDVNCAPVQLLDLEALEALDDL